MATTAILRSRDCLLRHHPNPNFTKPRRRLRRFESNGRDHPTRPPTNQNRTPNISSLPKNNNNNSSSSSSNSNLVMGQVKILKRGETLPDFLRTTTPCGNNNTSNCSNDNKTMAFRDGGDEEEDLILCSTGRLGPEPETVQKEIMVSDLYAGVAPFVASPPPSSLPFPAFFTKKEKVNDATSDLRRLLKLDLV